MRRKQPAGGVLASFAHTDRLMAALKAAKADGIEILDVYSPVPHHALGEFMQKRRSPVRFFTFTGALLGCFGGLALAILTSVIWNMIVGGKPVTALPPFMVVAFEGTILIGALATLVALLLLGGLPFRRFPTAAYRPEFSEDRFGVWLACDESSREHVIELLLSLGAQNVEKVDG
jgi:hypothetical protein